jgi:hypothetical protein
LSEALKEIIDARVTGGIHFRTADVQGAVLGKKVVHHMKKHYFQPTAEAKPSGSGVRLPQATPPPARTRAGHPGGRERLP